MNWQHALRITKCTHFEGHKQVNAKDILLFLAWFPKGLQTLKLNYCYHICTMMIFVWNRERGGNCLFLTVTFLCDIEACNKNVYTKFSPHDTFLE